jgi:LuxR family maltose regulon positive regulatory protein
MEQDQLLLTQLYIPPVRPELVSRPRLSERLNAGLNRKLTPVSAPAGFGKTTLLSEWVRKVGTHGVGAQQAAPLQVAWLSLDEGDNDPVRSQTYVIAALRTIKANMAEGLLSVLRTPQPPSTEVVLTALINQITALPDRVLLVLDDYHLIEAQEIRGAVAFLLQYLPPQMNLAIATREDPHLPFARLRARGQLIELRAAQLRFTSSEAAEFLNQVMGLDLSAEDIAALERRTEGWIAGLHLAAISMQGRSKDNRIQWAGG